MAETEELNAADVSQLMIANDWTAEMNQLGLWVVGPEDKEGVINVLGMGRSFMEAIEMARRTLE